MFICVSHALLQYISICSCIYYFFDIEYNKDFLVLQLFILTKPSIKKKKNFFLISYMKEKFFLHLFLILITNKLFHIIQGKLMKNSSADIPKNKNLCIVIRKKLLDLFLYFKKYLKPSTIYCTIFRIHFIGDSYIKGFREI